MFVATRAESGARPAAGAAADIRLDARFDIVKKQSADLISVSGGVSNGMGQIKLLFKSAYPNPFVWKTCVLVVRVPPGSILETTGVFPLLTIGSASCDGSACTDGAFSGNKRNERNGRNERNTSRIGFSVDSTRTLWYDPGKQCLLFGRTEASAMCAKCPDASQVSRGGLEVAIKYTERGGARQLVIAYDGVASYEATTDGGASTERPDASVLATGKVLFEMSPLVSDVGLFAHHSEVDKARYDIETFIARARGAAAHSAKAVTAVTTLALHALFTEFSQSPPGRACPCRGYTR